MRKRILIAAIICVALTVSVALALLSCNGDGAVTVIFIFRDNFTNHPIQGLTLIVNGETKQSDAEGKITQEVSDGLFKIYVDTEDLGVPAYESADGMRLYLEISVSESFERISYLAPAELPTLDTSISGTIENKDGAPLNSGDLYIYTAYGCMMGREESITGGNYSTDIYGTGEFYFIVEDDLGPNYYTIINVTGDGTYNVQYNGTDLNFSGESGDAEELSFFLVLGQQLIELDTFGLASPFDENLPHQGSDVLRLLTHKDTGEITNYYYLDPNEYTSSASGLTPSFGTGSTINPAATPADWSEIAWDEPSRTATWKPLGNATLYLVILADTEDGEMLYAFVQGTSFTLYPEVNLPDAVSNIGIIPIWSDGAGVDMYGIMGGEMQFLPADIMSGTAIIYKELMDLMVEY